MCEGGELWAQLRSDRDGGKMVGAPPSRARFWLAEAVVALEHMHARGVVHRDLKVRACSLSLSGMKLRSPPARTATSSPRT